MHGHMCRSCANVHVHVHVNFLTCNAAVSAFHQHQVARKIWMIISVIDSAWCTGATAGQAQAKVLGTPASHPADTEPCKAHLPTANATPATLQRLSVQLAASSANHANTCAYYALADMQMCCRPALL
jgi:hypothetical protein